MTGLLFLFPLQGHWRRVKRCDPRARALADGHYSRQTPGARDFLSNGRSLVLLSLDERAVWGVLENLDPVGQHRWRCTIFRRLNDCSARASTLIEEATRLTYLHWMRRYRGLPAVPLQTEVNAAKVRRKRDPGRCFVRAGWHRVAERRGLVILEAPAPHEFRGEGLLEGKTDG